MKACFNGNICKSILCQKVVLGIWNVLLSFSVDLISEQQIDKRRKGAIFDSRKMIRSEDKILKILGVSMAALELA